MDVFQNTFARASCQAAFGQKLIGVSKGTKENMKTTDTRDGIHEVDYDQREI